MKDNKVMDMLVNHIADDYELISIAYKRSDSQQLLDMVISKFVSDISLYCLECSYTPEGLTEMDLRSQVKGICTSAYGKTLLMDPIITKGLRNVFRPVDVESVYRMAWDKDYRFIPVEERPKPDFMNLPV